MNSSGYREFKIQNNALDFFKQLSEDEQNKRIILACDLDIDGLMHKKYKGCKKYGIIEYTKLFDFLSSLNPKYRCYYELLKKDVPTKMYFDVDGMFDESNNNDKIQHFKKSFHRDFVNFFSDMKQKNEFGCKCLRKSTNHLESVENGPYVMSVYDASTTTKFSQHIIFDDIIMKNNFHCGAIFRRFELWIIDKYGEDVEKNPYYITKIDNEGQKEFDFIIDRGVYTINRVFRLVFNSKAGQNRFIIPLQQSYYNIDRDEIKIIPFKNIRGMDLKSIFLNSFLQNIIHRPKYFIECCDVRSWVINENYDDSMNSDLSTHFTQNFEWIEPQSGYKIFYISVDRLKRMKYVKFINQSMMGGYSLNDSTNHSLTESSSMFFKFSDDSSNESLSPSASLDIIKKDVRMQKYTNLCFALNDFESSILNMFKIQMFNQRKIAALTRTRTKINESAQKYITTRCTPDWFYHNQHVDFSVFSDEKMINLKNGTVCVYPKGIRRCQFKNFAEHGGNHIYFVIHCQNSSGYTGFYQKCHSYHHLKTPSKKLEIPFRNNLEEQLFIDLQNQIKKFNDKIIKTSYDQIDINSQQKISSYILITIISQLFNHFVKSIMNNLFSVFNMITNNEMIHKSVEKLNNSILNYVGMIKCKGKKIDPKNFMKLFDKIMLKSFSQFSDDEKREYYLEKFIQYRLHIIRFSLSNMNMNTNFNNHSEKIFCDNLKKMGIDLKIDPKESETETSSKKKKKKNEKKTKKFKKNHSTTIIRRLESLTEKRLYEQYEEYLHHSDVSLDGSGSIPNLEEDNPQKDLKFFFQKMHLIYSDFLLKIYSSLVE